MSNRWFERTGLTVHRHSLLYGHEHGFGYGWLPHRVQRRIVAIVNPITCALFGHDAYESDECVNCDKRFPGKPRMGTDEWFEAHRRNTE